MMVTTSTIPSHEYSVKNTSIDIDKKQYSNKSIAVIAGISENYGVDIVKTFNKSINIPKFKVFLEDLRRRYFLENLCIYLDNLSVHTSNEIKERLDELSIRYIYNPIYSPDFNPIENIFSIAKRMVKKKRLQAIMSDEKPDIEHLIHESFEQINRTSIINCIANS